ncbi:MAG: aminoacyl-tRNA hydrolase [Alphaproteobacteria bacterium]|nr:aminoacyl-tRNA hydrolase [Alphaproteobacteria bacterium]
MENVLLIGLGNPGVEYTYSRHNSGFLIVDEIAKAVSSSSFKRSGGFVEISSFLLDRYKIILAKPQTFMNLSGRAVQFLIQFYKIPLNRVYVFHDDIDLPFARIKIKRGGGNGGHNGLKDIDKTVGSEYWRIRIGVGRPMEKTMVVSHVLGKFENEQIYKIQDIGKFISENLNVLLSENYKQLEQQLNL